MATNIFEFAHNFLKTYLIITCYLSTPFIILQIHKGASRDIFTNFLNAHPLTRPHPHAVKRKVIIISNCRLVPY